MIYEMTRDIAGRLKARRMPFRVEYGPLRLKRGPHEPLIVIERDPDVSDSLGPPRGQQRNARKFFVRGLAVKAMIYARSGLPGAHVGDHQRLCEQLNDMLTTELDKWLREARAAEQLQLTECRYAKPAEYGFEDAPETWPGVVFVLRFRVPRAVAELDYLGDARPTGSAEHVGGDVEIRLNGSAEPPEIVDLPLRPPLPPEPEEPEDP